MGKTSTSGSASRRNDSYDLQLWPDPRKLYPAEDVIPNTLGYRKRQTSNSASTTSRQNSRSSSGPLTHLDTASSGLASDMNPQADNCTVTSPADSDEDATQPKESDELSPPTDQEIQQIFEELFPSASPRMHPDDSDHIDLDAVFSAQRDPVMKRCAACQIAKIKCIPYPYGPSCTRCRRKKKRCSWGGQE
jgi:hypothetical protein